METEQGQRKPGENGTSPGDDPCAEGEMPSGHTDEKDSEREDKMAEAVAQLLAGAHRLKNGQQAKRPGGRSLGSLLYAWSDIGVQVLQRMATLGAELGDSAFSRTFGGGGGAAEHLGVRSRARMKWDKEGKATGTFKLINHRSGYVDVRFPTVVELHASNGNGRSLIDITFDPAAPLLGPNQEIEVKLSFRTNELEETKYIGWATIETAASGHCALAIELAPPQTPEAT